MHHGVKEKNEKEAKAQYGTCCLDILVSATLSETVACV